MSLIIIQWNIQGYTNNYNNLLILNKKYFPHIITLQETHIQYTNNIPTPINYILLANRATNRFGGVALLVHKSIQYSIVNIPNDFEDLAIHIKSKQNMHVKTNFHCSKQNRHKPNA